MCRSSVRMGWVKLVAVLVITANAFRLPADEAIAYQRAPEAIRAVLDAPLPPTLSIDPTRRRILFAEPQRYPPIAELAQPMLQLAGLRINPRNNGPYLPNYYTSLSIQTIADGKRTSVALPVGARIYGPRWSPDGTRLALALLSDDAIELWVVDAENGAARRIAPLRLNAAYGEPFAWMPDSRTLLCQAIVSSRGEPPAAPLVPAGPVVQETDGRAGPVRTYQDLLDSPHEEALFDYYATSQLALVHDDGRIASLGSPGIFSGTSVSPDGQLVLVTRVQRPYSYLLPVALFPREVAVWNLSGEQVYQVASLPLQERIPIEGVPTGRRNIQWRPTEPATLVWVEALDEGDPRRTVPHRDRVSMLTQPFTAEPTEIARTEHRFTSLTWAATDGAALLREYDRDRRWTRTYLIHADRPGEPGKLIWDRSAQDRYGDPGTPLTRALANGHRVLRQDGSAIFLVGDGATPAGDRPFLDRFDLATGRSERLFQCDEQSYEQVVTLLADDGSQFITRRETPASPPNLYLRGGEQQEPHALTDFPDPTPQLRTIRKQLVTYRRSDGVPLSFTLYLPPGYEPGKRLPTLVWAYPREFNDASTAGQVSGSTRRFTTIAGTSHLFFVLAGYAVLDNASMPVIGTPETMNDTYVQQIVASAQAAIDKAVEMGVTDRERVGVGGHSYGAFMTANLLAHCDLFRAGIARSGAYNRTLTPFGFQSERRTLWEAPEAYFKVSPFLVADRIREPLLLIHGAADDNTGTFPMQSERMYQAVRGNGGIARLVMLPHESHGCVARESVEHTLYEMISWLDRHVKNAASPLPPSEPRKSLDFNDLQRVAEDELRATSTPGAAIAIVRGGEIVYSRGFGVANVETGEPVKPEMLFRLGSTTKMFTAAALVSLAVEGKLDLHQPIGKTIPDLEPQIAALTAHQLLTHTAGLTDESVMSGMQDDRVLEEFVRSMDGSWLFTQPGQIYSYANPGYWLAGRACEVIENAAYADVLAKRIFQPVGMKRTTVRPLMAMSWPLALGHEVRSGRPAVVRPQADNAATRPAGQIYSNVLELSRFATMLLNQGRLDGQQVLAPAVVEQLTTPHVKRPGTGDQYGYGLIVTERRGVRLFQHGGSRTGYGSGIYLAPDHGVAVVVLANRSGSSLPRTTEKALEIALPLGERPKRDTSESLTWTEDVLAQLVGVYSNNRQTVELSAGGGKLLMRRRTSGGANRKPQEVHPAGRDAIRYEAGDGDRSPERIFVVRGADGKAEYLCISGRALRRQETAASSSATQ